MTYILISEIADFSALCVCVSTHCASPVKSVWAFCITHICQRCQTDSCRHTLRCQQFLPHSLPPYFYQFLSLFITLSLSHAVHSSPVASGSETDDEQVCVGMLCSVSSTDCEIFLTFVMFIYKPDVIYAGTQTQICTLVQCNVNVLSCFTVHTYYTFLHYCGRNTPDGVSLKCLCFWMCHLR